LESKVENHVYLRVSPMKSVKRFGVKGKLAPRYIRRFPILEKCGTVYYKLDLPPSLTGVHNIFHVSQLKKCLKAPMDVVLPEVAPLEADLSYPKHPTKILDQKDRVTRLEVECSLFLLEPPLLPILETRFLLGGRAVTPHVSNPYD
jgi:hypothetical protein